MTLAGHNFAGLQGESTVSFVNGSGSATVVSTVDSWSDAQVKVQLPTKLQSEERQLLEQLASHHATKGQKHPHKSGLFGGLFG